MRHCIDRPVPRRARDLSTHAIAVLTAFAALLCACARGGEREEMAPAAVAATAPGPVAAATSAAPASAGARDAAGLEDLLARCRDAASYSREHDGDLVLVVRDGVAIFEDGAGAHTARTPHLLASGTKSFVGVAAMCAVADGLLTLDEPVSATIHEWSFDPRKSSVTIRQLLSLASGLEGLSATIDSAANARAAGITDRATASIAARSLAAPGERFIYGPSSFYVFGELLKRKLVAAKTGDADIAAYLDRRIFTPLGIKPSFMRDEAGNPNMAGGCRISAEDWARFGEFMRNGGMHDGRSLLAPELVAQLTTATGPNPRYGLTWWLLDSSGEDAEDLVAADMAADRLESADGPIRRRLAQRMRERARNEEAAARDAAAARAPSESPLGFMAAGKGKQRLYVLPEHGLTIVRFGALTGSRDFHDAEFLGKLLGPSKDAPTEHSAGESEGESQVEPGAPR